MFEQFKINIDRLRGGKIEKIKGPFPPDFLDVEEDELKFRSPVEVEGECYITEEDLIVHLTASTVALMPCKICNEMSEVKISTTDFYDNIPLNDLTNYDFGLALREALLIEVPGITECNGGHCPSRESLKQFLE